MMRRVHSHQTRFRLREIPRVEDNIKLSQMTMEDPPKLFAIEYFDEPDIIDIVRVGDD